MEWVKVTDRLPENEGMYIVFGTTEMGVSCIQTMALFKNYKWYIDGELGWNLLTDSYWHFEEDQITHWMPLPSLPKEPCPLYESERCNCHLR